MASDLIRQLRTIRPCSFLIAPRKCSMLVSVLVCASSQSYAGVEVDFWHSYRHQPTGVTHFAFHIASYKRGLFFGSCGPSTKSLQWEYEVDLCGDGPTYKAHQITITSEGKNMEVASGTIMIVAQKATAKIDLRMQAGGNSTNFVGNGSYRIKAIR